MRIEALLLAGLVALGGGASVARAEDAPEAQDTASGRYSPPSKNFVCDLPRGWTAFAEDEADDIEAVHLLGPENSAGTYRAGIDIRYYEKGAPGFVPYKTAVEQMRRSDGQTDRDSTPIRAMRVGAGLARTFEVSETRRLPADRLPSTTEPLHRSYAIFPNGESYFVVTLSSTREVYLDYRELFVDFLRTFRPLGLK